MSTGIVRPVTVGEQERLRYHLPAQHVYHELEAGGYQLAGEWVQELTRRTATPFRAYLDAGLPAFILVSLSPDEGLYLDWLTWFEDGSSLTTSSSENLAEPSRPAFQRLQSLPGATWETLRDEHVQELRRLVESGEVTPVSHDEALLLKRIEHDWEDRLRAFEVAMPPFDGLGDGPDDDD